MRGYHVLLFVLGSVALLWCLMLAGCDPTVADLACVDDLECALRWPSFAPRCHAGVCSQCDIDQDCISDLLEVGDDVDLVCIDNPQGFGTCLPTVSE